MRLDPSTLVLAGLALVFAVVAYFKDPSLPLIGARNGLSMLGFVLPRLVPALLLAGLFQVVVPQEIVSRYFGREAGVKGLVMAMVAGVITPGGPMVSVPFLVALAHSGAALPALVTYMTAWSLFGLQRIIAWEAPLMGWRFVIVRVVPSLAFPVVAGSLAAVFSRECARSASERVPRSPGARRPSRADRASPPRGRPGLARPRDHRDHRSRLEGPGRPEPGPPLRARRGLRHAGARQHVRGGRPAGDGARRRPSGRAGRARRQAPRREASRDVRRAAAKARHALRPREGRAPARDGGTVPGGGGNRAPVAREPAGAALLAQGRWPLHHAAVRLHPRPSHRPAQRRDVPAPGVRRPDARHALADAQGRGRARARGAGSARVPRPHARGDRPRRRSRDDLRGVGAPAAGRGRGRLRGLAPRERRGDGGVPDDRRRGARARRDRARGLRGPARAPARGTVWRPHGLLLARPRLSRLPPDGDHTPRSATGSAASSGSTRPRRARSTTSCSPGPRRS